MKALTLLILLLSAIPVSAQEADSSLSDYERFRQARARNVLPDSVETMLNESLLQDSVGSVTDANFREFSMAHQKRAYMWQFISSIVIFIVVISIVLAGLYLSYQQFTLSKNLLLKGRPDGASVTEDVAKLMNANLEVGKEGFKINSAVIGLVILIISLTFFFLYLKYVYPINVMKG